MSSSLFANYDKEHGRAFPLRLAYKERERGKWTETEGGLRYSSHVLRIYPKNKTAVDDNDDETRSTCLDFQSFPTFPIKTFESCSGYMVFVFIKP